MKILKYAFYIVVAVSMVYFTFDLKKKKENVNSLYVEKSKLESELYELEGIRLLDSLEIKNEFQSLKNVQLQDEAKNTVFLKDELNNELTLIYRYFDVNCKVCIIDVLKNLNRLLEDKSKLKVIASYQNDRELLIFKRVNTIQTEIYNIGSEKLINELDLLETAYLLLVDKDLEIKSVHVLSKELKKRNTLYVNHMINFLNILDKK